MSKPETPAEKPVNHSATPTNVVLILAGLLVLAAYTFLLRRWSPLDMGRYTFQFFPVPWFTPIGEFLFILLLTIVAMWHVKLALGKPKTGSLTQRMSKMSQYAFALVLLLVPLIFRAVAEFLLKLING